MDHYLSQLNDEVEIEILCNDVSREYLNALQFPTSNKKNFLISANVDKAERLVKYLVPFLIEIQ